MKGGIVLSKGNSYNGVIIFILCFIAVSGILAWITR
jgi:hypothetical protein